VTRRFREGLSGLGLEVLDGESAIIPCIVGEEARARDLGDALFERGVLVTPFAYPVVPRGTARLRVQASTALRDEDVDRALDAFRMVTPHRH
jgi:glycine C-acetyltransferase